MKFLYRWEVPAVLLGTQIAGLLPTTAKWCARRLDGKAVGPGYPGEEDLALADPPCDPTFEKARLYYFTRDDFYPAATGSKDVFYRERGGRVAVRFAVEKLPFGKDYDDLTLVTSTWEAGATWFRVFESHPVEKPIIPPSAVEIKMADGSWSPLPSVTLDTTESPFGRSAVIAEYIRREIPEASQFQLSVLWEDGPAACGWICSPSKVLVSKLLEMCEIPASKVRQNRNGDYGYEIPAHYPTLVKFPHTTISSLVEALQTAKDYGSPLGGSDEVAEQKPAFWKKLLGL